MSEQPERIRAELRERQWDSDEGIRVVKGVGKGQGKVQKPWHLADEICYSPFISKLFLFHV